MKRLIGLGAGLALLGLAGVANASLIDLGNGVIHDDVANQYWFQDLSTFKNLDYETQLYEIESLNMFDAGYWDDRWGDWRMANLNDMQNLWSYDASEITSIFTQTVIDDENNRRFEGRYNEAYSSRPNEHFMANLLIYPTGYARKSPLSAYPISDAQGFVTIGAWAVVDATSPAPEPTTIFLFGTGIAGLAALGRRRRK
ncbi:PEP-CTERM sorting domain-containing protein [Desulfogranum marinum]|uniref:PEP-CTERM sorting domain-containing protein n=1 Tax=Desulfogranum marinum TaxID=453220 RepID=UPI0029C6E05B|nr:PEP-CTERM sorting domain-containing protein [Desulfogranum marinum]